MSQMINMTKKVAIPFQACTSNVDRKFGVKSGRIRLLGEYG